MATKDITDLQVLQAYERYRADFGYPSIRDALHALAEADAGVIKFPEQILMEQTGQSEKVCIRAMERAESRGLIECGVSLRTGWPTDKGRELLSKE